MFARIRRWRFVRRTAASLVREGLVPALEATAAWVVLYGDAPWAAVGERAADVGRVPLAIEFLSHAPECDDVLVLLCALERQQAPGSERGTLQRLARRQPGNQAVAVRLAEQLMSEGGYAAAVALLAPFSGSRQARTVHALGSAFAGVGRRDEAISVLRPYLEQRQDAYVAASVEVQEMKRLYRSLVAQQDGDEAMTLELLRKGQLDAGSGINHRLLARSLMLDSPRRAPRLELASLEELDKLATELRTDDVSAAAVQAGELALRREDLSSANGHFERGRAIDSSHFGAALGLAVVLDVRQRDLLKSAHAIPVEAEPAALRAIVPDWNALTALERRLVVASTWPVRGLLPAMARAGSVIRVLPLDVRPTDLPELRALRGVRVGEDHRSWEGIEGLAGERLAVAKVEGLVDTTADGLTFAHELAHLAELVLPHRLRVRLDQLYAQARTMEFAFHQYALRNVHEFFAVHATFALLRYLGRELPTQFDDSGALKAVLDFFDEVRRADQVDATAEAKYRLN